MSFGAKALRDVRTGGGTSPGANNNGTSRQTPSRSVSVSDAPPRANGTITSAREGKGRGLFPRRPSLIHICFHSSSSALPQF
jgi:hypothetical protein